MAKSEKKPLRVNVPCRVLPETIEQLKGITTKLSKETGFTISTGQAVERAVKELHAKMCGQNP
jgi:hypothetical protein